MDKLIELRKLNEAATKANTVRVMGNGTVMPTGLPSFTIAHYSTDEVLGWFQSFGFTHWPIGSGMSQTFVVARIASERK